ncbi:MAG: aerobic-type carbon monoxide dehydrogenase, large subunit-like protein [Cyanobacteria bacterium RYN_339]|nr:aerobic-type carbon monoxide dehydrogenase, large subunit-like protein [Cyanobacteria bacterium RYN_339]
MSKLSRRGFLRMGALAGAGLVVGFEWPGAGAAVAKSGIATPNAFLRIAQDGGVTVLVPKSEMGQGVLTSLAQIVAEELDVAWSQVRAEEAAAAKPYRLGVLGQMTAGSDSVRGTWDPLRKAGASARTMLVEAAAESWGVSPDSCTTFEGVVSHAPTGRKAGYGELAERASRRSEPWWPKLKRASEYKIVGQRIPRLDTRLKVDGSAQYGIDVRLPGMLVACVARCPVFGGKVKTYDGSKATAIPGVRQVVQISNGVAVVADHYWAARKGVEALVITWDEGPNATFSTAGQREAYATLALQLGREINARGHAGRGLRQAKGQTIEALFELPFLAHATMEPMNCTAVVGPGTCEVWAPTQAQTGVQAAAAKVLDMDPDKVVVNTTFLGGGFGRRAESDFVTEAVELARATGKPIKVVWSRPDDMHHDFYRAANTHLITAATDAEGWPTAWKHQLVVSSIFDRIMPSMAWLIHDPTAITGLDENFPYAVPDLRIGVTESDTPVPVGFWRSVGFSYNVFVVEHMLDELARLTQKDPLEVRRRLITEHPRLRAVMDLAAEKAGWGKPLPKGHYHGLAVASPFGSHVAEVAEISIEDGEVRVHRVVAAVDCGQVINPAIVEAQIEGGIVFGLSAALKGEITLKDGRVQQNNFGEYAVLRHHEMPAVEVHILHTANAPGGIGEVGVPCAGAAVANAVLAATGKPLRSLPIKL